MQTNITAWTSAHVWNQTEPGLRWLYCCCAECHAIRDTLQLKISTVFNTCSMWTIRPVRQLLLFLTMHYSFVSSACILDPCVVQWWYDYCVFHAGILLAEVGNCKSWLHCVGIPAWQHNKAERTQDGKGHNMYQGCLYFLFDWFYCSLSFLSSFYSILYFPSCNGICFTKMVISPVFGTGLAH